LQHLGKDLLIDGNGDLKLSPTGDLDLLSGGECLMQDVRHRLETGFGDVFTHGDFGSILFQFLGQADTELNRTLIKRTVENALENERRIKSETIEVVIQKYSPEDIWLNISFRSSDNIHPFSFVWKVSIDDMEKLI